MLIKTIFQNEKITNMKKRSWKWLRVIGIIIGVILSGLVILYLIFNENRPKGVASQEAEHLAHNIQKAINIEAWDTTEAVSWNFGDRHTFLWDKKRHWVKVNWSDYEALIRIDSVDGRVWKNGEEITSKKKQKLIKQGLHFWMNDSFWLNAPAKIFDKGTERKVVDYEGEETLMVTYTSGGATPGDSYLWFFDENGLPTKWKMWVKIIPIGGVETSWEQWITTSTGAKIATLHIGGPINLEMKDVKAGALSDFGEDPFTPLLELD